MRFLHTADWHLGRQLHRHSLVEHQRAFLRAIAQSVTDHAVDVVLISGDVYDRALPPASAVELLDDVLAQLLRTGARVVMTSGNHDSTTRLGFGSRYLAAAGLHIRTDVHAALEPVILHDECGPLWLFAVPFVEPMAMAHLLPDDVPATHHHCLAWVFDRIRQVVQEGGSPRWVAMAHAFVTGAAPSDSERSVSVGGVEHIGAEVFQGAEYVALGHLHRPQLVADHIRYSGSPLPYSFSESGTEKGWWIVDVGSSGDMQAEFVPNQAAPQLQSVRGTMLELLPSHHDLPDRSAFYDVTVTDQELPRDAMATLREHYPNICLLHHDPPHRPQLSTHYRTVVGGLSDTDITTQFIEHTRGTTASAADTALLQQAWAAYRQTQDER